MTKIIHHLSTIVLALCLAWVACSCGDSETNEQFNFLKELGITINDGLLLSDTLSLPDVYCGDPNQRTSDLKGKHLNSDQYQALIVPAGHDIPDAMSNWMLLGVRDMGNGITLAAYYACSGMGYCVDLITYDKAGHLLDAINARELHLVWRCHMSNNDDDTSFTLDGLFTFEADRMTLHRVMGQCKMDYDNDLKGAPQWQQQWDQSYVIDTKGHFILQGQKVVKEQGTVDQYAALDFKSWDMLVCSLHDPGIMDTWNEYSKLANSIYDPEYEYNPIPWDVSNLYHMNPQRFLRWMAAHRDQGNHLLPQFKLPPRDRPALLQEISRLDDPSARQWLTSIVESWDEKLLTKHL